MEIILKITTVFTTICKMKFSKSGLFHTAVSAIALAAFSASFTGCVNIDDRLGSNLIPKNELLRVITSQPLALGEDDIEMRATDSLSGYNYSRFTFGAINDGTFGLNRRGTSFTLIPLADTLDFGKDPKVLQFHFTAVRDTFSVAHAGQENIIQNIRVYEMKAPLDTFILYNGDFDKIREKDKVNPENIGKLNKQIYVDESHLITKGLPTYSGGDSLSFDFTTAFAEKIMAGCNDKEMNFDSLSNMVKHLPGIYIETDDPLGYGGRINMFKIALETDDYNYVTGNYANLKIRSKYEKGGEMVEKDTSFLFIFGPATSLKGLSSAPDQYAYNASYDSGSLGSTNADDQHLYVSGGGGYKPVIKASAIKRIVTEAIEAQAPGVDISRIIINKATIVMPFDNAMNGGDWEQIDNYPHYLSPTCQFSNSDGTKVTYAGLTDSSVSSENQGDINRSTLRYMPDISHHVQEILRMDKSEYEDEAAYNKELKERDIWMLILHNEVTTTSSSSNNNYSDYYNNLMYNAYYNNLYNGYGGYGYGGYGYGYGGYGYGYDSYGYSNYYNYLMMAAYASSANSSSTSTSTQLDKDRFYNCRLNSCKSANGPYIKITFSAPVTEDEEE